MRLSKGNEGGEKSERTGAVTGCALIAEQSGDVKESDPTARMSSSGL